MDLKALFTVACSALVGGGATAGVLWLTRGAPPAPADPVALTAPPEDWAEDPTIVVADPVTGARADPAPGAPHLVLVIGCTLRRDQTSVYGPVAGTTPFLESLAGDGVRFEDVVTAAPWTRAASTAIVTGRHPVSIGMVDPSPKRSEHVLPDTVVTLAEALRDHGYATAGMTTNPNLNAAYGFDQGFDRYRQLEYLWRDRNIKLSGAAAVPLAVDLLDDLDPDRPVFLQVVLVDTHAPFRASEAELEGLSDPTVPDEVVQYRGVVRRFDAAVRRLDTALQRRGLTPDNTVFVVVNDHGEGLGFPAHHGGSHGRFLAPSAVGGVFLVRGPGVAVGHTVGGLVSQIDITPTVLGILDLPPPPTDGRDWSEQARGHQDRTGQDRAFADTWFREADRAAMYTPDRACQRDFGVRRSAGGDGFEDGCFDRRLDPDHATPLDDPEGLAELTRWREAQVAAGRAFGPSATIAPSEGLQRQLEALGYVDGPQ